MDNLMTIQLSEHFIFYLFLTRLLLNVKQNRQGRIKDWCTGPGSPVSKKNWGLFLVNFDCLTCICFNCSHHAMCTISFLLSTLTPKR